jgi:predicted MPP superfamily phosphohydrolase
MNAPASQMPRAGRRLSALSLVLLLVLAAFVAWTLIEPRTLRVSEVTVTSPDLPAEFSGTRAAFFADVHAGPYYSRRRVAKLVDRVNALHPDIILIGGDNVGGRSNGASSFYPEAARLRAPLGVYGVLGNHDYWEGEAVAKRLSARAGIRLLDNTNVPVRKGAAAIRLGGVEDLWAGHPDFAKAARGISPNDFALLLCHNPDALANGLPDSPDVWDVALTGHMHAGQITFFGLWAPIVPSAYGQRYRVGWVEENGCLILITTGVGEVTLPVRFFAPPEINLITLERGPELGVHGARVSR